MSVLWGGFRRHAAYGLVAVSFMGAASALAYFSFAPEDDGKDLFSGPGISITRKAAPLKSAALGAEVEHLFSYKGKNDRADYVAAQIAIARQALQETEAAAASSGQDSAPRSEPPRGDVQFVTAALTPLDFARPGPTRAAGAFQQSVNRGGKADRVVTSSPTSDTVPHAVPASDAVPQNIPASFTPEPGPAAQIASLPQSDEGISAALFLLSPTPEQPQPQTQAVASADGVRATWDDLIKLARVTGGDGEEIKSGIFGALSEKEFRAREFRCMATAIYFEARGETVQGQTAIGQVIMTRVRSDYYPNTICGVVYQGQWNRNACQFSFACDGEPDAPKNRQQWETAINVAKKVISGEAYIREVGEATHYHASYVSPDWRRKMDKVAKIGVHIFYKAPFVRPLVASAEQNGL